MATHLGSFLLLALAAAGPPERGEPVLRVGIATRNPPWAFVGDLDLSREDFGKDPHLTPEQLHKLVGIDVDVMGALAPRLGVRVEWVPTLWASLEEKLLARRYDVLIGAWTPNAKTPDTIAATAPYLDWGLVLVVRADDQTIRSPADLDGKRVGHIQDPAVERSLRAIGRGRFVAMERELVLLDAFKEGTLDAMLLDSTFARWRIAHDPSLRMVGAPLNRLGYHLGVRREDTALFERVEAAVKGLLESGEAERIGRRWEGPDSPPPPQGSRK